MTTTSASQRAITVNVTGRGSTDRDWFLRDSCWDDSVWIFAPTNVLEERAPPRIRWDFMLPSGQCFTDPAYASLLQTTKQLIALIRTRSLFTGLPHRSRTAVGYFVHLRPLLRSMDQEGQSRFSDLDRAAVRQYENAIRKRVGRGNKPILCNTVRDYLKVLIYLYRCRDELGDGLPEDPFPGERAGVESGARMSRYTPDVIAIPLVQKSIEFLEVGAIDILRAREIYAAAVAEALERIRANYNCNRHVLQALAEIPIHTPHGPQRILCMQSLSDFVNMLYAACFVVIAYLVGARVSEILHLRPGCVASRASRGMAGDADITVMLGSLFKHQAEYHGRAHEWVVPQAAIHAIAVLEALSAPHRLRSGRDELWVRVHGSHGGGGATEWQRQRTGPMPARLTTTATITDQLRRYSRWLNLPLVDGRPWQLTAREARKTFARFAALRDRTGLYALAQQLGHRDRSITDSGYAGTDYVLEREIQAEVLEQSVLAWEHMLSSPQLGGRAGREILAKRPQFRGARMKDDIKTYARTLAEAGLLLGVCDYGYCVYRQEYSACRGNVAGPNPIYREPSTCARCLNFAVSTQHRPYWLGQVRRCETLLNEPALPTQTLKIARERLEEARRMLGSIDSCPKENARDRQSA
jgi:integrase